MSTTITRGRLFRVTVTVNDRLLEVMKKAPQVAQAALAAGADFWHTGILPRHFEPQARAMYGYARRTKQYLKEKGGGPDLVNSGAMAQQLKSTAQFSVNGSAANLVLQLKMSARTLNLVPKAPQDSMDYYVTHRTRKGGVKTYPNLKREIKFVRDNELEKIAAVMVGVIDKAFGDAQGRESDD